MTVSSTYASPMDAQAAAAAASGSQPTATNALAKLAGNFQDFLSLLTTQLKNQDPTSPMDTNAFTSQLVQFTSVSEQISTNGTLNQILAANLSQQLGQASSLVGSKVSFSGGTLPLQGGAAALNFQSAGAQPVDVSVSDAHGNTVHSETVKAADGNNTWSWDGTGPAGTVLPDGAYTVAVTAAGTAVPFQAIGTVTGAEQANQAVQLQFGGASAPYSQVVSLRGI
jgi:flagellar basal-body rod modification protein FlgD